MRIILQPYQTIRLASLTVGISPHALRRGCRDGSVPHIRSGRTYYVDVPALLDKLAADRQGGGSEEGR